MKWNGLPVLIFGSEGISKETYYIIQQIHSSSNVQISDSIGLVEECESQIGNDVISGP